MVKNKMITPPLDSAANTESRLPDKPVSHYARYAAIFSALFILMAFILVFNVNTGSVHISVTDIIKIVFTRSGEQTLVNIVWKIRLPRVIMAALLGGALALSGFLLQTFFGNPIASPFVLGISSGAKLVIALVMIFALSYFHRVNSALLIAASFVGSLLSLLFILAISRKIRHMSTLLVVGIMIGYICSAVTELVITFASDSDIVNLHNWSQGSFSGTNWDNVAVAAVLVLMVAVSVFFMSKPIGAFQLGEAYAQSMGVNLKIFRVALILTASLLAACVTAFAGPVSFVGIAVPHLVRVGMNTSKPIIIIPACFLGGGVFCMGCDLIARTMFAPTELSISTVTAIFGAPVVIAMLIGRKRKV